MNATRIAGREPEHPGHGMSMRFSIELAFEDASGRTWVRREKLERINRDPPVGWLMGVKVGRRFIDRTKHSNSIRRDSLAFSVFRFELRPNAPPRAQASHLWRVGKRRQSFGTITLDRGCSAHTKARPRGRAFEACQGTVVSPGSADPGSTGEQVFHPRPGARFGLAASRSCCTRRFRKRRATP